MPLSLLRFSAEYLKILLNFSSVIASHSFVEILRIPGKGVNSISFVGFENRFQGQTSWHISQPNAQFSNLPALLQEWDRSQLKERYLNSTNYRQLQNRHLALKLISRWEEFNNALGFQFDAATLTGAAETRAAVAV